MKENITKRIVKTALIASIYTVITLIFAPISYLAIQFRVSEIFVLLAFVDPLYIGGLTLGCLVANILGGLGLLDIIFGTLATLISLLFIYWTSRFIKQKKISLIIASLWPAIFNGIIVGFVINITTSEPLIISILQVAFGEFVVITLIGIPIFKALKSTKLKEVLL